MDSSHVDTPNSHLRTGKFQQSIRFMFVSDMHGKFKMFLCDSSAEFDDDCGYFKALLYSHFSLAG